MLFYEITAMTVCYPDQIPHLSSTDWDSTIEIAQEFPTRLFDTNITIYLRRYNLRKLMALPLLRDAALSGLFERNGHLYSNRLHAMLQDAFTLYKITNPLGSPLVSTRICLIRDTSDPNHLRVTGSICAPLLYNPLTTGLRPLAPSDKRYNKMCAVTVPLSPQSPYEPLIDFSGRTHLPRQIKAAQTYMALRAPLLEALDSSPLIDYF
jgi:hypothetical protein